MFLPVCRHAKVPLKLSLIESKCDTWDTAKRVSIGRTLLILTRSQDECQYLGQYTNNATRTTILSHTPFDDRDDYYNANKRQSNTVVMKGSRNLLYLSRRSGLCPRPYSPPRRPHPPLLESPCCR